MKLFIFWFVIIILMYTFFNCNYSQELFKDDNWHPYGDNIGNTGTFENQQSSAIPALVEKITNCIK